MYSMKNRYLFWDLIKISTNTFVKLLMFLKINYKWVLDDRKSDLNVKIIEISKHK